MRFTVHDSPDYYQLKVSVFNDDKKTELIGETWIALDKIIIPGGGQNDLWHHLNCKGRFAGEIRIELTYYDTRPKDENPKIEEKRQGTPINTIQEQTVRGGMSGPRQPKATKRRPLPADPTESFTPRSTMQGHIQSPPAPYTPSPSDQTPSRVQSQNLEQPTDYRSDVTLPSNPRHQQFQNDEDQGQPLNELYESHNSYNPYDPAPSFSSPSMPQPHSTTELRPHPVPQGFDHYDQDYELPSRHHSLGSENHDHRIPLPRNSDSETPTRHHPDEPENHDHTTPFPRGFDYETPTRNRSTGTSLPRNWDHEAPSRHHSMGGDQDHRNSRSATSAYETPMRHHSLGADEDPWSSPVQPKIDDNGPPPPPPAHRSSGLQSQHQSGGRGHSETYLPLSAPAPLKIRNHRGSATASPLSQVQSNTASTAYVPSTSPSNSQPFSDSAAPVSSFSAYSRPGRRKSQNLLSQSPTREFSHDLPSSLMPGYGPSTVEDETHIGMGQIYPSEPSTQYQALPARTSQPPTCPSTYSDIYPSPRNDIYPSPRADGHSPLLQLENNSQERASHSSSTPTGIKQHAISPDPRTPSRKPVNPAPESAHGPKSLSAIPFSPDSYDTFNPSASSSTLVNSTGPKYNTPEQARQAPREREKELKLAEGPIIDDDGRVIDPSDHLPVDTWAPEPEPRHPRRGPEVTVRFRHSPQGAQPMPPSGTRRLLQDTSTHPHSITNPIYAHSPETNSAGRNRPFKKSRVSPAQPASSPVVPTLTNDINHTGRLSMTRASTIGYSTLDHEGLGYCGDNSPGYKLRNLVPPPVPGKIPIAASQRSHEDLRLSALSEEMRRIDIGVGGGQRSRRSRYGP